MENYLDIKNLKQTAILRAADDLRRGLPVIIEDNTAPFSLVAFPAEFANDDSVAAFDQAFDGSPSGDNASDSVILVTDHRAQALKVASKGWPVVMIERTDWMQAADMVAIADPTLDMSTPLKGPFTRVEQEPLDIHRAAVKLLKIARLLPAVLIKAVSKMTTDGLLLLKVSSDHILEFDAHQSLLVTQVASAKVPLEGAENAKLYSFRPRSGGVEHIAILVGDPSRDKPVLTRLHSECFTGDLLGSLKCDCGDQLKGAIKSAADAGGGLILYMEQEGRGIGLTSKLKAYSLQDQGYDTVDANTSLGFDIDERIFLPAAEMVKQLGFSQIKLMTNNPNKVDALSRAGLTIVERVPHKFASNPHNEKYLKVKKDRTGHML